MASIARIIGRVARTMLELADHFGQEVAPGRIVIQTILPPWQASRARI
jgi:hypothetical protein